MRYPKFLQENGTIGFIAPSFGCATEPYSSCFDNAKNYFAEKGFNMVEGPNCRISEGIGKSNTPEACGAEVNDFFINNRCDAIISCGGGETMCEDLPYIDFAGISKAEPKWYLGYSDNTNLTFTLPTLCDTAAIYGPCVAEFGMRPLHPAVEDALKVLTGEKLIEHNYEGWESEGTKSEDNPFETYNITEPYKQVVSGNKEKAAAFEGRLIGGCLDCLSVLVGTPFDKVEDFSERYKEDGIIWFIESCELSAMGVKRALWQLDQAGWFKNVKGFLFGRPIRYDDEFLGFGMHDAVNSILSKYDVPIIMDLDIGHMSPQMPLISGAYGCVTTKENEISIEMKLK